MPEGIEIEYYRREAEKTIARTIVAVEANDHYYLKGQTTTERLQKALVGKQLLKSRRIGKLLLLDVDGGDALGLRFGMTGRIIVDDVAVIESLEYSSKRNNPAWDRFIIKFYGGGSMHIRDPRRLGGVELNPNVSEFGYDLYAITSRELFGVLAGSSRPIKARLMDQSEVAGLGNLLTDEILWRASIDPRRPADSLDQKERRRLYSHFTKTITELTSQGGSHTGNLQDHRVHGGLCPRHGIPLERYRIGGRTTYSCPEHQKR